MARSLRTKTILFAAAVAGAAILLLGLGIVSAIQTGPAQVLLLLDGTLIATPEKKIIDAKFLDTAAANDLIAEAIRYLPADEFVERVKTVHSPRKAARKK